MNTITHRACGCGIEHKIPQSQIDQALASARHEQYLVELSDGFTPVMDEYRGLAAALDKDQDGIVSSDEILPPTHQIGHAQVDQPDFTFGFKHKLAGWASPYADHYPSAHQIDHHTRALAKRFPELSQTFRLGQSAEGRELLALRIGAGDPKGKPSILVVGGQHAREWAGSSAVTEAMERLLEGYGGNEQLTSWLDQMQIWFVPMANPDGYEYSRNADPDWRKNRSHHLGIEGVGTDLNRNYRADFRFLKDVPGRIDDDAGASDNPRHLTFRGPHALSEQETQALTQLIDTQENLQGIVDVHGFGRMILFPGVQDPQRDQQYRQVAEGINARLDLPFTPLAVPELYPTTGDITAYGEKRGILSMALEIGTSFQPSPDKLPEIRRRGADAILGFVEQVAGQAGISESVQSTPA